jgi:hypothetical protein
MRVLFSLAILGVLVMGCTSESEGPAELATGDTVVARWSGSSFYEGKVESLTETKVKVAWADGSKPTEVDRASVFALPEADAKPDAKSGDYVLAKWGTGTRWYGARITAETGEKIPVEYSSDGTTGNLAPDKVIAIPDTIAAEFKTQEELRELVTKAKAAGLPAKPEGWKPKVGDKVVAVWSSGSYYSGKVKSLAGDKATVAWDDGSKPSESAIATMGPEPGPGDKVLPAQGEYVMVKSGTKWIYGQALSIGDGQFEVKLQTGQKKTVKPGAFLLLKK